MRHKRVPLSNRALRPLCEGTPGCICTRTATYTDGQRHFCTQHAKEFGTVLRKATNKIREGLIRIEEVK